MPNIQDYINEALPTAFPELITRSGQNLGRSADVVSEHKKLKPGEIGIRVRYPKTAQRFTIVALAVEGTTVRLTPRDQAGMADAMALMQRLARRWGEEGNEPGPIRCDVLKVADSKRNSLTCDFWTTEQAISGRAAAHAQRLEEKAARKAKAAEQSRPGQGQSKADDEAAKAARAEAEAASKAAREAEAAAASAAQESASEDPEKNDAQSKRSRGNR